jgi:hypothetical protein
MNVLKKYIDNAGGVQAVATACDVSPRAVYKWLNTDSLPRTDYTNETSYAEKIAALCVKQGHSVNAQQILLEASPKKQVA